MLALIVSVTSLLFGIFSTMRSKGLEESNILYKVEIARKSAELINAEIEIRQHLRVIAAFQLSIDSLKLEKEKINQLEDSLRGVFQDHTMLIDSLKNSLDENHPYPAFTDDKHIELFLHWTSPQ